jgi:hypothetical protein
MAIFLHMMDTITENGTPASMSVINAKNYSSELMKEFRELYCEGTESIVTYMVEHGAYREPNQ